MISAATRHAIAASMRETWADPVAKLLHREACRRGWVRRWRCPAGQRAYYRKLLRCGVARDVARKEVS